MNAGAAPILLWFRRDLRLSDHIALTAAAQTGAPVIPVFIWDEVMEKMGAAPRWRMGQGVQNFSNVLRGIGSRLILRRGPAEAVLTDLAAETGAAAVYWSRCYDPDSIARDTNVKTLLKNKGLEAKSFAGHLLFEPWDVQTGEGKYYRVYSPMWRNVRGREVGAEAPKMDKLRPPNNWPDTEKLEDWSLGSRLFRGAEVLSRHAVVGEAAAQDRLAEFIAERLHNYKKRRDFLAEDATSGLSENLTYGEISPRQCWRAATRAAEEGNPGAEHFMKELVWREFAYHLAYHTPEIIEKNWREGWDHFPWSEDESGAAAQSWKQARTGVELVDAGLREMYVTGRMHNRARMIVASYLTKNLMLHWKIGLNWFADCLTDWDPAANAMGWQWVAGSGPDAAPYFRIFNPATQAEKFDPDGTYRTRWLAERSAAPARDALSYFDAIPKAWGLSASDPYPSPVVDLKAGRDAALAAYAARDF